MAGTSDTTRSAIDDYRWSRFMEMGFSDKRALKLALAKGDNGWPLDTHKVQKALNNGCSLSLAFRIYGPL